MSIIGRWLGLPIRVLLAAIGLILALTFRLILAMFNPYAEYEYSTVQVIDAILDWAWATDSSSSGGEGA